ncbi:hypothetical protein BKA60DRAFT_470054 [Fusarium oxysporum]|nr:hypothetical protein BKA60DRAFT_470054 [Fusarium oxysporum]
MKGDKFHIAIAGAGIAGLSLALLLQERSISCAVYELRPSTVPKPGALMLAPNALRILDKIGLFTKIRAKGYNFDTIHFKDFAGQTIDRFLMGSEAQYGFHAIRIHRETVMAELKNLAKERAIPIHFEKQISSVIHENEAGVAFQFSDGSVGQASILIGADGIHSAVRNYICPQHNPEYSGQLAISAVIQQNSLSLPLNIRQSLPAIFVGKNRPFLMLPQSYDGSEIVVATQFRYQEQDKVGWLSLATDEPKLRNLLKESIGEWQALVQSSLEDVRYDAISTWPYYALPSLPSWVSRGKRVALIGDAAHAISPTGGQGACQAIEDAFTLAVLLSGLPSFDLLGEGLAYWEKVRRERIEKVKKLTLQLGNSRLPQHEREQLPEGHYWNSGEQPDLHWLYGEPVGDEISEWCVLNV